MWLKRTRLANRTPHPRVHKSVSQSSDYAQNDGDNTETKKVERKTKPLGSTPELPVPKLGCAFFVPTMMSDITNNGSAATAGASAGATGGACAAPSASASPSGTFTNTSAGVELIVTDKAPEECRSGDLAQGEYHQAAKIGEGAFGAITEVYNDEGEVFALKTFEEGEDTSADIGTLREMSFLRLLRGDLAHPFVMQATDFYVSDIDNAFCMVMPKAVGSLMNVLEGSIRLEKQGGKPRIAHQVLCALTFLHDNGIMHRDVKPDNVLLNAALQPILCDLSLSKFAGLGAYEGATHSGDAGTAVYMAPEVTLFLAARF